MLHYEDAALRRRVVAARARNSSARENERFCEMLLAHTQTYLVDFDELC